MTGMNFVGFVMPHSEAGWVETWEIASRWVKRSDGRLAQSEVRGKRPGIALYDGWKV